MVKNSKGTLSGNTRKLRGRLALTVSSRVKTFEIGTKVVINQVPSPKGQPHMRYKGRHGIVVKKQGNCYVVEIADGRSKKKLVSGPIHLKSA